VAAHPAKERWDEGFSMQLKEKKKKKRNTKARSDRSRNRHAIRRHEYVR
jgi:hypothetical protein